jgi:hypothetical protein
MNQSLRVERCANAAAASAHSVHETREQRSYTKESKKQENLFKGKTFLAESSTHFDF